MKESDLNTHNPQTKYNTKRIVKWLSVLLGIVFLWWLVGELMSINIGRHDYDIPITELEKELINTPMIVPDIDFDVYGDEYANIEFRKERWGRKHNIWYGLESPRTNGTTVFESLIISCVFSERLPENAQYKCNTTLFGVDMLEISSNVSQNRDYLLGRDFPDGTFAYVFYYSFNYQGCFYDVIKELALPPDVLKEKDQDAEVARIKAELQAIVKSIIEKGQATPA